MKLREVMTRQVHLISVDESLQSAAEMMRDEDIGMIPVFNGSDVVGVLTDRDIVVNATARGLNPVRARVSDAMTKNVISCVEEMRVEDAVEIMKTNQIRRLLVTDRDRRPVGVVSIGDIATRVEKPEMVESVLHEVSEDRAGLHH